MNHVEGEGKSILVTGGAGFVYDFFEFSSTSNLRVALTWLFIWLKRTHTTK